MGVYTKLLLEALKKDGTHTIMEFSGRQGVPKGADLVHYPYFDPFFLTLNPTRIPFVVTVHDLIPIVFPDRFPRGIKGELKWQVQKYGLKKAKHIITDSEASKRDVARLIGFSSGRITPVLLAPQTGLKPVKKKAAGFPDRYFLYVGDLNWNKNVVGLLAAFAQVHQNFPETHLGLVGSVFLREDVLEAQAAAAAVWSLGLDKVVHRVGRISEEDLAAAYTNAIACVLPSHYEGFGLPVLEAFACGCPVVCATGSSLDEIAGPAVRVNPADTKSIADGMIRAMNLPQAARADMVKKGAQWVRKFSWEKVARETIAVYES